MQGQLSDSPVVEPGVSGSHVALGVTVTLPYCDMYLNEASSFPHCIPSLS